MNDSEEALFCNDAFYQAFLSRDISAMNNTWAKNAALLCIHPGGQALTGREDVITSWQNIIAHNTCPRIMHKVDQITLYEGMVLITCYEWDERQPDHFLLATNGFVREEGRYRMVFHQAGPTPIGPVETDTEVEKPVH